jgi:hypothetical protein
MPSRSLVLLGALVLSPALAHAQVTVAVDPSTNPHAISPLIYGMNFATSQQVSQGGVTMTRWGGDATTRYNYQIDVTNTASDYYFENVAGCWSSAGNWCSPPTTDPMTNSGANAYVQAIMSNGMTGLLTVPTIGYVARGPAPYSQPLPCGCPKSDNPNQDSFDPYDTNCGNGQVSGAWITCPNPETTTSAAITPVWNQDWVSYLVSSFGPSNGHVIYELDNEPNLWNSTHHDVHPTPLTYDELWQAMQTNATAVLAADPTALIAGFEEWGWPNYFCSAEDLAANDSCSATSTDRAAHGGEDLTSWILDQAAAYERANGQRILHALDLHYYPQGGSAPQNLRSLWDPAYTDPSWINSIIMLIPRMRSWVAQHYPGTMIGISEYEWSGYDTGLAVVTYAEILGIFGREGLDYATAWAAPAPTDNAFEAFRLYRNYDGNGSQFQSVGVQTTVTGANFQAFGSVSETEMTVVLVNESSSAVPTTVSFGDFQPSGTTAEYYEVSGTHIAPTAVTLNGTASLTVSPTTAGILVVQGTNPNMLPAPDGGTPDAGATDSGPIDAGPVDAGERDAGGHDAGEPDAGKPDSGEPDAGRRDAGELSGDAGDRIDAGLEADAGEPVDAGETDGGSVDGGPEDAGFVDGGPSAVSDDAGGTTSGVRRGCGCTGVAGPEWLPLAPLLLQRRRRRRTSP